MEIRPGVRKNKTFVTLNLGIKSLVNASYGLYYNANQVPGGENMVVKVDNLVKRYGNLVALDHFNLQVGEGEISDS